MCCLCLLGNCFSLIYIFQLVSFVSTSIFLLIYLHCSVFNFSDDAILFVVDINFLRWFFVFIIAILQLHRIPNYIKMKLPSKNAVVFDCLSWYFGRFNAVK